MVAPKTRRNPEPLFTDGRTPCAGDPLKPQVKALDE